MLMLGMRNRMRRGHSDGNEWNGSGLWFIGV
jgi:hypothetical protein